MVWREGEFRGRVWWDAAGKDSSGDGTCAFVSFTNDAPVLGPCAGPTRRPAAILKQEKEGNNAKQSIPMCSYRGGIFREMHYGPLFGAHARTSSHGTTHEHHVKMMEFVRAF